MNNSDVAEFFTTSAVNIHGNVSLRDPQREAYLALQEHFSESTEPCYVQLPVGCGKTGLMGLTPFGMSRGRVLIVAPNLTIKANIIRELDISDPDCFFIKRGVISNPQAGPFISELKANANIHDCDSAHFVIANVQQFSGANNKWYEKFPQDYFQMILVDEGHHNVADTWRRLFEYFSNAKVVSYTATPQRSDGKSVMGKKVYSFGYARSMMMGFISPIESVHVAPTELAFVVEGETKRLSIDEVIKMRENDWFSRGVALSPECNRSIVEASIQQLREVRKHGQPRQIIASTCSIRHAKQVAALYHEYGYKSEVLHSQLPKEERDRIEAALRAGLIDVIAQVQMLGEGYDLGSLSVAAVFRPFRSLSPYIQFVGRILRLAAPHAIGSPANQVYVVSHVGLNDERWWSDFTNFDKQDQDFFAEYLAGEDDQRDIEGGDGVGRLTLRPFMRVLNEVVDVYLQKGYLKQIDESLISNVLETIRSRGFDPLEFGLTEDMMRRRLEMAALAEREVPAATLVVQPQRRKESLRMQLSPEARAIANTVLTRLNLQFGARDLLRHFPAKGESNGVIITSLASGFQNKRMGVESGDRDSASIEQLEKGVAASADIADAITAIVRQKQKG